MGNLTFHIPTENKNEFNLDFILKLISEKFPDLVVKLDGENKGNIYDKRGDLITAIYEDECYILNFEEDIERLSELEFKSEDLKLIEYYNKLKTELIILKNKKPDLNNSISTTYGYGIDFDRKKDIDFTIRDYFKGYIFDEGIHPEFIGPSYVRREKKKGKFRNLMDFLGFNK